MKWENGLNHKNEDLTFKLEKAKWLKNSSAYPKQGCDTT